MNGPPEEFLRIVLPLVDRAREFVEAGESLQPMAFVAGAADGGVLSVSIDTGDEAAKDRTAECIRQAAGEADADFVFTVLEAWGLPRDKMPRYRQILAEYGSIAACPYRVDTAAFMLETRNGVWAGQVRLKPKGASKKKRTFGPVTFEFMDGVEGRFAGLLPRRGGQALH